MLQGRAAVSEQWIIELHPLGAREITRKKRGFAANKDLEIAISQDQGRKMWVKDNFVQGWPSENQHNDSLWNLQHLGVPV